MPACTVEHNQTSTHTKLGINTKQFEPSAKGALCTGIQLRPTMSRLVCIFVVTLLTGYSTGLLIEPRPEKTGFCICKNKTAKLISAFVSVIRIVNSLYYLHPKFQATSDLLWLYRPACVGPGRKPRRPVFSQRGSIYFNSLHTG